MKKYYPLTFAFWIGFSVLVIILSYRLNLGEFTEPGPGFFPFLLGVLLFIVSSTFLVRWFLKKKEASEDLIQPKAGKSFFKPCLILISLFAYALLLEKLGYLIASFLILVLLFRSMSALKWPALLGLALLVSVSTYFTFSSLGIKLPVGVLQDLLR